MTYRLLTASQLTSIERIGRTAPIQAPTWRALVAEGGISILWAGLLRGFRDRIQANLQRTPSQAQNQLDEETVVIVSGLPRSGTSMMMKMLEAGGVPVLTDGIRTPDRDNPKGYYEFERVKQIEHDQAWLEDAKGKAVKMVSELLKYLPDKYTYRVIFMRRNMEEILASQRQMLIRQGRANDEVDNEKLADLFEKHLKQITGWIEAQPGVDVLYVSYNEVLADPIAQVERINGFLGNALDVNEMVGVVDPSLYRQRE